MRLGRGSWALVLPLLIACGSDETPDRAGSPVDASTEEAAGPADPYDIVAFDAVRIGSDSSKPNFQNADAAVELSDGPFASVALVVDLQTTCFPFESWQNNPPPSGENWPADCDAFDRNFEFTLDPPSDPATDPPGIELVRAITPFGGPMHYEVDITDVANARPGLHQLRVHITTWSDSSGQVSGSDGGWTVSATLRVVPGAPPREVLAVVPLFNGSQTTPEGFDAFPFEAPAGTTSGRVDYRTTGHGGVQFTAGCGASPAEEFCLRTHDIYVDGNLIDSVQPWRSDCAELCTLRHYDNASGGFDYCAENPCGAIDSVRASRANWCPGSITPPLSWSGPRLGTAGEHSFRWRISDVADGGSWRISATYFAFGG